MRRPVSLFVGLRYLRSQKSNLFASFVTFASVAGVALGVAALIVVLSVMNGFENELRGRLLSMTAHGTVLAQADSPWRDWIRSLGVTPGVVGAAPHIELEAVASSGRELSGILLSGIDPQLENAVSEVDIGMLSGQLADLAPGEQRIVIGRALALRLGVNQGDLLTVMVPRKERGQGLKTGMRQFTIAGIFELGLSDHDSVRGLIHIADAAAIASYGDRVSGVRVRTDDVFAAPGLLREWAAQWGAQAGAEPAVRDWTEDNASYFRAVQIEKIMMALLLSLIVAVAAFNIVATLVMVVSDKRSGIAILRTLGYPKREIVSIFALQGVIVGWFGVIIGVSLGVYLALNINTLAPRLESLFGFEFMPADVYYLTSLPAELQAGDVSVVALVALLLTGLATIYPAARAAGVSPAEVLRYE